MCELIAALMPLHLVRRGEIVSVTLEFRKGICGIFATTVEKNWAKIGISKQISRQVPDRSSPYF